MRKILRFVSMLAAVLSITACGLIELDSIPVLPSEMHLERDTLFVMNGDRFKVTPVFSPDSITLSDVFLMSQYDSIVYVDGDTLQAVGEGWTTVTAVSISQLLQDSCKVCVMPRWESNGYAYPYEMVIYSDVSVRGKAFDPSKMMLAAFVGDEVRGVGELRQWNDTRYVVFRIGSYMSSEDPDGISETVFFRVYYKEEMRYEAFRQTIQFDGETHGTLSDLLDLAIDK